MKRRASSVERIAQSSSRRKPGPSVVCSALVLALLIARPAAAQRDSSAAQRAALKAAKGAQQQFERQRRQRLPTFLGGSSGGACEVRIGRLCYWNNNGDAPPPREPPTIAVARDTLLARLAHFASAARSVDSADGWIVGQRVRYLIEARRLDEAAAIAGDCRAGASWCAALRGLVAHERSDHAAADSAFDTALAALPAAERCRWTDLSWWLDGALARDYRRQPCGPARDDWERRFWLVARPLLLLPGNDLRAELLARRTMSRIRSQGALEYQMTWGDDFAELEARYGWPIAWSARQTTSYSLTPDLSVVGHEPTPSYAFVPRASAVAAPTASDDGDWSLDAALAVTRYAPRYAAGGVSALPHQLARFRRGDSTLVVAAWSIDSTAWVTDTSATAQEPNARTPNGTTPGVTAPIVTAPNVLSPNTQAPNDTAPNVTAPAAALVLVDTSLTPTVVRDSALRWRGGLTAFVPDGAYLASVEVVSPHHRRAARDRYGLTTLPRDTLVSDLLLLATPPPPDAPLDSLLATALGSRTIVAGTPIGLYWETYFPPDTAPRAAPPAQPEQAAEQPAEPSAEVTVRATRIDAAWYARVGRALRLDGLLGGGPQTPISVRFMDAPRPGAASHARVRARTLVVTWPPDAPGTYRLEVAVRAGTRAATAVEIVRVLRR